MVALGGCWWLGSFPGGRGASGRGRGGRAQQERGGSGRPRARQVAGWPRSCRRAGGSGGSSGDCSCSSLRIFLGQVQDGGAPCTGFPVTLAMGRTTKEGGRRMRELEKTVEGRGAQERLLSRVWAAFPKLSTGLNPAEHSGEPPGGQWSLPRRTVRGGGP